VVITTRGKLVFVAESFPLDVARKLTALILDAQGTGDLKMASVAAPVTGSRDSAEAASRPLTADMVRFFSGAGVMKSAVEGALRGSGPRP
jgi:hypothetical protein